MKVLAIVPAKGNSRRLPGKNKRVLGGKPLFLHAVDAAKDAGCSVVVSTDDDEIAAASVLKNVFVQSEPKGGFPGGLDEVRRKILDARPFAFDAVLMLLPTYPFRSVADVKRLIGMLEESPAEEAQSATVVDRMGGMMLPNSYLAGRCLHADAETKGVRLYFPIDRRRGIDIDTQDDWDRAERVLPLFDFKTGVWRDGYAEGK